MQSALMPQSRRLEHYPSYSGSLFMMNVANQLYYPSIHKMNNSLAICNFVCVGVVKKRLGTLIKIV